MTLARCALYSLLLTAIMAGGPTQLAAQGPDTAQVREAIALLERRLNADPRLPRAFQGRPFAELIDGLGFAQVLRLEDAELRIGTKALHEALLRLDPVTCNRLTGVGPTGPDTDLETGLMLFATADSVQLDRWADVLGAMLRVKVDKTRVGPTATEAEANAAVLALITRLPEDEQQRLLAGLESTEPVERCWSIRAFFRELSLLPAAELGPLARSILRRK